MSGLIVGVRNVGKSYSGFKVAFCDSRIGFTCQFKSYKADLVVATGSDFVDVFVPWKAFSNKWDAATGKHTAENPDGQQPEVHYAASAVDRGRGGRLPSAGQIHQGGNYGREGPRPPGLRRGSRRGVGLMYGRSVSVPCPPRRSKHVFVLCGPDSADRSQAKDTVRTDAFFSLECGACAPTAGSAMK